MIKYEQPLLEAQAMAHTEKQDTGWELYKLTSLENQEFSVIAVCTSKPVDTTKQKEHS